MTRSDLRDLASRLEDLGWSDTGARADIITRHDSMTNSVVAVANDGQTGEPAISLWWPETRTALREIAFWMTPDDARDIALSLLAAAMKAEDRR